MENKKLFISSLIVLLGVSSLTGCGETNVSTSSSQNQITSSSSNDTSNTAFPLSR